jgi:hypothetical protein
MPFYMAGKAQMGTFTGSYAAPTNQMQTIPETRTSDVHHRHPAPLLHEYMPSRVPVFGGAAWFYEYGQGTLSGEKKASGRHVRPAGGRVSG